MHSEKIQLDQIQNETTIDHYILDMPNMRQTVQDSYTITIKQNVRFQGGICSEKYQLNQIQNGRLSATIDFIMQTMWSAAQRLRLWTNIKPASAQRLVFTG